MAEKFKVPVEKGKIYTIDIVRLGAGGEGVGRVENFTVFVDGTLPGETVTARITYVKKQYAVGRPESIQKASPHRVKPSCPVYADCGGCQLQHLSYEGQLAEKQRQVKDAVEHIGKLKDIPVLPTLGSERPWNYRNKMQLPVGGEKKTVHIGCFAEKSHCIIDIDACPIQKDGNNQIIPVVRQWMKDYKIPAYDEDRRTGIVRHIMGRTGVHSGEIMVCIVTAVPVVPHMKDLVHMLRKEVPGLTSVMQNINTRHTNVILGNKTKVIYGSPTISDSIGDLNFRISAQSFFQVNSEQAQKLYETALSYANLTGQETVVDVYCGTGTITLFLAKQARYVYGIEIVEPAVRDAVKNAKDNGIRNAHFTCGDAAYKLPELLQSGIKPDVIVIDPPRAGCEEKVLNVITSVKPKRVVYVSCNPATLARDLAYMKTRGYKTEKIRPVDMFPQTHHVECVALLSKLDSKRHISVELPIEELDLTSAESKATYKQIQNYVFEKFGFKVSTLYIAQVKRKYGLDIGEHYNISKNENQKVPQCPIEKEEAILDALKHFKMIKDGF